MNLYENKNKLSYKCIEEKKKCIHKLITATQSMIIIFLGNFYNLQNFICGEKQFVKRAPNNKNLLDYDTPSSVLRL